MKTSKLISVLVAALFIAPAYAQLGGALGGGIGGNVGGSIGGGGGIGGIGGSGGNAGLGSATALQRDVQQQTRIDNLRAEEALRNANTRKLETDASSKLDRSNSIVLDGTVNDIEKKAQLDNLRDHLGDADSEKSSTKSAKAKSASNLNAKEVVDGNLGSGKGALSGAVDESLASKENAQLGKGDAKTSKTSNKQAKRPSDNKLVNLPDQKGAGDVALSPVAREKRIAEGVADGSLISPEGDKLVSRDITAEKAEKGRKASASQSGERQALSLPSTKGVNEAVEGKVSHDKRIVAGVADHSLVKSGVRSHGDGQSKAAKKEAKASKGSKDTTVARKSGVNGVLDGSLAAKRNAASSVANDNLVKAAASGSGSGSSDTKTASGKKDAHLVGSSGANGVLDSSADVEKNAASSLKGSNSSSASASKSDSAGAKVAGKQAKADANGDVSADQRSNVQVAERRHQGAAAQKSN